eukprot:TRINITY_DN9197_c0_g1_i1.p1 TRINITY_DN9197_c0_g1~~TRINITY_DN9197_c0_g1_i1.p1  ORF type:complete len:1301 (+),score=235.11 TRINITY_DN9197_c0_g1_i1:399-3905(+)
MTRAVTEAAASLKPTAEPESKPSLGMWEHNAVCTACGIHLDPESPPPGLEYVEVLHAVLLSEGLDHVSYTHIPLIFSAHPQGGDPNYAQRAHANAVAYFVHNPPSGPEQDAVATELRRALAKEWAAVACKGNRPFLCRFLNTPEGEALLRDVAWCEDPAATMAVADVLRFWGASFREEMTRADPCDTQQSSLNRLHKFLEGKKAPSTRALGVLLRAEVSVARRQRWLGSQYSRSTSLAGLFGRPRLDLVAQFIAQQTPNYPTCPPAEVNHSQFLIRQSTNKLREGLHSSFLNVLRDAANREPVLDWFAALLLSNGDRTSLSPQNWQQKAFRVADDVFMVNLALVIFRLLAPAIEKNSPISTGYVHHASRLEFSAERCLGESPGAAPASPVPSGGFNFSTEIFFVALKSLQVAVLPAVHRFKWLYEQFARLMEAMQMSEDREGLAEHSRKLSSVFHAQQTLVEDPELLEKANQLCLFTCKLLLQLCENGRKEEALAGWPSFVVDSVVDWFAFLCQFCPTAVQGLGADCKHMVDFTIFAMHSPTLLKREKRTQAKLVMVLNALRPQNRGQQELSFGNSFANYSWGGIGERHLFHIVEESPLAQRHLPEALMAVYVGVENVEGIDVDAGDESLHAARHHALSLLRHIHIIPTFRASLMKLLEEGSETLVNFVKSLVNDSIHCLDDSLSRLREVRDLQQAIKNRDEWSRQPENVQRTRKQHLQAQERSSRGFMRSAVENLEALQLFMKPFPTGDYLSPAFSLPLLLDQIAHLIVHFLAMLAGPRCDALQDLETPKKYNYDRLGLLHMIVQMVVHLSQSPNLIPCVLKHDDFSMANVQWSLEKVNSTGIGGLSTQESFCKLVASLTAQYRPSGSNVGSTQVALSEEAQAALVVFLAAELTEQQYIEALREVQVDSADMSDEGTYAGHHYHQNIAASQSDLPKPKRRKLMQETRMLNEGGVLPLRPEASIFLRSDESRMDVLRAVVTGPEGTPYAFGCFVMDIFCPNEYPSIPPMVNLITTGSGTVRFNPNLYESGKICLSLLGTWHGDDPYSKWDADRSSLYQVLASIQGMILVPEPYFNEPAYEAQQGTQEGTRYSQEYNERIQIATLRHAIVGVLQQPPTGLAEVIRRHFKLSRSRIARQCEAWLRAVGPELRERMLRAVEAALLELARLD